MHGPLVGWIIGAVEGAVVVGGLSALGAGLYSMGIPTDSVVEYETALKSDNFLVVAHGTEDEVAQAKPMLETTGRCPSACRHVHTRGSPVEQRLRHSREGSVVTVRVMANRCRPDDRSAYRGSSWSRAMSGPCCRQLEESPCANRHKAIRSGDPALDAIT